MAKFVPLMIGLIMVGIFSISLLTGGVMIQLQNDAPLITNDSDIGAFYTSVNDTLYSSATSTTSANEAFTNSSIQTSGAGPYMSAVGGIWNVIKGAPVGLFNLVVTLIFVKIFGDAAAVVLTIATASIVTLVIISAVVLWVSRGEGG